MFTRPFAAAALAALLLLARDHAADAAAPDATFRVVVNAANPTTSATRLELASIFLRRTQRWPDGRAIVPVDLPDSAAVRAAFSAQVVGKSVAGVKGYWQQQLFTGHGVPPVVEASEADVLAFVGASAGAVGYVSAAAALPAAVKSFRVDQ